MIVKDQQQRAGGLNMPQNLKKSLVLPTSLACARRGWNLLRGEASHGIFLALAASGWVSYANNMEIFLALSQCWFACMQRGLTFASPRSANHVSPDAKTCYQQTLRSRTVPLQLEQ